MGSLEIISFAIGIIGFLGGLPQIFGYNWKDLWLYYYRGVISWRKVHQTVLEVKYKLYEDSYKPDVIIGIGRGGAICAGLLCSELMDEVDGYHPRIEIVNSKVVFRKRDSRAKVERIELSKQDFSDISVVPSQKVVIIIAQSFTGHSLQEALGKILAKQIPRENIRTVALFWHRNPKLKVKVIHQPDIVGKYLPIGKTTPWKMHQESPTDRFR